MPQSVTKQFNVGEIVRARGFITQAAFLRMQPASEIESRVGYRKGRLANGWYLLFLTQMPTAIQFDCRGYSYLSNGIEFGHLPNPPDQRTPEQRLADGRYDVARLKKTLIADVFTLNGHRRLAKVLPVLGEFGDSDYPPGTGIPQWKLLADLPFVVAEHIAPGGVYSGMYTSSR